MFPCTGFQQSVLIICLSLQIIFWRIVFKWLSLSLHPRKRRRKRRMKKVVKMMMYVWILIWKIKQGPFLVLQLECNSFGTVEANISSSFPVFNVWMRLLLTSAVELILQFTRARRKFSFSFHVLLTYFSLKLKLKCFWEWSLVTLEREMEKYELGGTFLGWKYRFSPFFSCSWYCQCLHTLSRK